MPTSANHVLERSKEQLLDIRPLQPTIGAEILGIDLSNPLSPELRNAIRAAVLKHKVIFFRDQTLTNEQHTSFAANFGPLYTHPGTRGAAKKGPLYQISANTNAVIETRAPRHYGAGDGYHTDTSWRLVPTWGAVLRAVNLPPVGGDTIWVDGNLAYEGLSEDVKGRLEGLHVTHDYREWLSDAGLDYPIVAHPLVRTHRETGQKILWANFTLHPQILGIELSDSRALLDEILRQYKRPEFQVRFSWAPGSVAFWDNRAAVHYGVKNYGDFPRLLERTLIVDEPLYADL